MTSRDYLPEVTILCEDIDQERFIREYLICCGLDDRRIKDFGNPKGKTIKNNNALIVKHYPELIKSYRSRNYRNIAVVVMIDADEDSLDDRMRSLNIALDETAGNLNVRIQVFDWGIREGMKKSQQWADRGSRKKAIALLP